MIWSPKPLATLEYARSEVTNWLLITYPQQFERRKHPLADKLDFKRLWTMPWPFRWSTLSGDSSDAASAAKGVLEAWRNRHPISTRDEWIMDAAIHAIAYSARHDRPLEWAYSPDKRIVAPFQADLPPWTWHPQRGEDAARRMEQKLVALLRQQLRAYRARINKHYGQVKPRGIHAGKDTGFRDALWTAKACSGLSHYQISKEAWMEETKMEVPEADRTQGEDTVRLAVYRFAAGIGLHLPNSARR